MFYDNYVRLCILRGIKPSRAAEEAGVPRSAVANWKNKQEHGVEVLPTNATLVKLLNYFSVSADELLGNKNTPAEAEVGSDKAIVMKALGSLPPEGQKDLMEYIRFLLMKYEEPSKLDAPLEE